MLLSKKINEKIMFNESVYLRYQILEDAISKIPINTSYKGLCEMHGDISYSEFEFWYYRFYNGQRDLDYDRSEDPKPLTFSDLPIDVFEKIVDKLEIKSRHILREVSRYLKSAVDSSLLRMKIIDVSILQSLAITCADDVKKQFYSHSAHNFPYVWCAGLRDKACDFLSTFIKNPKLQLESLHLNFTYAWPMTNIFDKVFRSLPHKLHLRSLIMIDLTQEELSEVIICVKPKVLKKLEIRSREAEPTIFHDLVDLSNGNKLRKSSFSTQSLATLLTSFISNVSIFFWMCSH